MYSMLTIVYNSVLYIWKLLSAILKFVILKKKVQLCVVMGVN